MVSLFFWISLKTFTIQLIIIQLIINFKLIELTGLIVFSLYNKNNNNNDMDDDDL